MADYRDDMKDTSWYQDEMAFHASMRQNNFIYKDGRAWLCHECGCKVEKDYADKHRRRCPITTTEDN